MAAEGVYRAGTGKDFAALIHTAGNEILLPGPNEIR
jgi:hypothetical protein